MQESIQGAADNAGRLHLNSMLLYRLLGMFAESRRLGESRAIEGQIEIGSCGDCSNLHVPTPRSSLALRIWFELRLSGRQDNKRRPRRRLLSVLVLHPYFAFHRVSVAVYVCACDLPLAHQVLVGSIHITVLAGDPGQLSPASDSVYQQLTEKEGFH